MHAADFHLKHTEMQMHAIMKNCLFGIHLARCREQSTQFGFKIIECCERILSSAIIENENLFKDEK